MEPIDSLETLRSVLQTLAQRGFVVYLTPPGRRGTTLTHGMYEPAELEELKRSASSRAAQAEEVAAGSTPASRSSLQQEVESLRAVVAELQANVTALAERVGKLEQGRHQPL